ncbi:M56 family metallopeptidase [Flavobacterium sp. RNTU_13]|uniref:M56 family metallopeptidase n=1 Tax=Flavobacterium sp. RNTU_13 TaxID=3375145 RepID=UPI003987EF33
METYILKSILLLGIFLAAYHLLLSREKMHRFNRFYLLGSLLFSLVLPVITIPIYVEAEASPPPEEAMQLVAAAPVATTEVVQTPYLFYAAVGGYVLVVTLLAVRFMLNILKFYRAKRGKTLLDYKGATLVLLKDEMPPHTFLNYIFISDKEYERRLTEPELLTHELAHVHQKHTLDVLFIELLKTVFWFNPFLYLYKRAIQTNHEFLADDAVIHQHLNITTYQSLLLDKATPPMAYALASSINFSLTKKRFIMMTKTTTRLKAALLQASVLPVFAALVLIFSVEVEAQSVPVSKTEATLSKPKKASTSASAPLKTKSIALKHGKKITASPLKKSDSKKKEKGVHKAGLPSDSNVGSEQDKATADQQPVYNFTELDPQPEFPGGIGEFMKLVIKEFRVPDVKEDKPLRVYVQFVIETDGSMSGFKILRDPGYGLGNEAIRALKTITTKWNPGKVKGAAVRTSYALPITVNLKA